MNIQNNAAGRCSHFRGTRHEQGFCYLLEIRVETKLDAYWLIEDIEETLPDVNCEFVDETFQNLRLSSKLPLQMSELKSIFRHYIMEYQILDSREPENWHFESHNSLLELH